MDSQILKEDTSMIKINFCDMYKDFDREDNVITSILRKEFGEVEFCERPDFLFFGPFGTNHHKYSNCVRIFYTGEAIAPDFNDCDYAIAFDPIVFGNRYMRRPVWIDENIPESLTLTNEEALNRKFCNFIYSNDKNGRGASLRKEFAKKLMKYKHIDCPGKVLNNMDNMAGDRFDNWRQSKVKFISGYKFTIAFENAAYDGYTTEKMTQPLSAHSIPIYWGNPSVTKDFNEDAFINANDYEGRLDELVQLIIDIDNDDERYLKMLHAKPMSDTFNYSEMEDMEQFITDIIYRGNKPIEKDPLMFARRMSVDSLSRKEKIKYFLCK